MNDDPVFLLYLMTKYLDGQLVFYKMKELFKSVTLVAGTVEPTDINRFQAINRSTNSQSGLP